MFTINKSVSVWDQLVQLPFLNLYSRLLNAAMELDVFSQLCQPVTAEALAVHMGWHKANTEYLLSALVSIGFLNKTDGTYQNTAEVDRYLVKGKDEYLGGFLPFYMQEGMAPMDVKLLVTKGPQSQQQEAMEQQLDFASFAQRMRQAQEGYRQQELLRIVRSLPENDQIRRVLDLGGATGLLGLAVIGDRPDRTGVLFDRFPPAVVEESISLMGLTDRTEVMCGNFMADRIGERYDLILALNVMLFAKGRMEELLKKCYDALNPGGVLLVISEAILPDHTGPWDMVMGYLPYYFQGMDMGVLKNEVSDAAVRVGFTKCEKRTECLCSGTQDIDIIRK